MLGALYDRVAESAYSLAVRILGRPEAAEEVDAAVFAQMRDEARKLMAEGTIREGMIPKVDFCLAALGHGVERCHVIDGRIRHAILLEIFTDGGVGTLITR